MGPGDGIQIQRLMDLPTTLETADQVCISNKSKTLFCDFSCFEGDSTYDFYLFFVIFELNMIWFDMPVADMSYIST